MSYVNFDDNGRQVKCRKPHNCEWCNEIINIGDQAAVRKYMYDGDFRSAHQHPECFEGMDKSDVADGFAEGEQQRGWTLDESEDALYCCNCEKVFKHTTDHKSSDNDLCCSDKCAKELDIFLAEAK